MDVRGGEALRLGDRQAGQPHSRDRLRATVGRPEAGEIVPVDDGSDPAETAERRDAVSERARLLAELKPDERRALLLFALGYSYKEIAARQGWSYTKVNRCVGEGRAALRSRIGGGSEQPVD